MTLPALPLAGWRGALPPQPQFAYLQGGVGWTSEPGAEGGGKTFLSGTGAPVVLLGALEKARPSHLPGEARPGSWVGRSLGWGWLGRTGGGGWGYRESSWCPGPEASQV